MKCPKCNHSNSVIPIIYGMPIGEIGEAWERGEVFLGGCLITGDDPTHFCKRCLIKFDGDDKITELTWDEKMGWGNEGSNVTDNKQHKL